MCTEKEKQHNMVKVVKSSLHSLHPLKSAKIQTLQKMAYYLHFFFTIYIFMAHRAFRVLCLHLQPTVLYYIFPVNLC